MHFDLRLEIGGALRSFAVPRGPSLNPQDKRLAVETEDHPLEYLDFEAVIPPGNYGAGSMIVWDRGAVTYLDGSAEAGYQRGKIDFALSGHKLQGRFGLIRTSGRKGEALPRQPQWLLVKKADPHCRTEDVTEQAPWSVLSGLTVEQLPKWLERTRHIAQLARSLGARTLEQEVPSRLVPTACALEGGPIDHPDWLYELKLDGVRILSQRTADDVVLRYRTGRNASMSYPEVVRALRALPAQRLILDGEIVALDDQGRPNFQKLGQRIQATREYEARKAARSVAVGYWVFDILIYDDLDLRDLPLQRRKQVLAALLPGKGVVRMLDHIEAQGSALLAFCRAQGLEGVVGKRASSRYSAGPQRSPDWIKHKCEREDDFVVIGYTEGSGSRSELGALELASYRQDGQLHTVGRVGSGLNESSIALLLQQFAAGGRADCAARGELLPSRKPRHFVDPEWVVSVRYAGWTDGGRIRHGVFRGLRTDVPTTSCRAAPPETREAQALEAVEVADQARDPAGPRGRVQLTNQQKVFWPDEGFTKGDVCSYYDRIADTLVPYLRGRPVLMVRYPDGIEGKRFYQWNVPAGLPSWVGTFQLRTEAADGKEVSAFLVDSRDTLLFMANMGAIPLHILASRATDLERSDFLTIDFDIGTAPLSQAITLARTLHELLTSIGLVGFPKTSGQSGLHVLVPTGGARFATTKLLAELLGRLLHMRHPDLSSMERLRSKRGPGVYIDTGQTGRSRAIVAPYAVRAYRGASVSTPLTWDEVSFNLDPKRHHMFSVPERVAQAGDPLAPLLHHPADIDAAVQALGLLLGR